MRASIFSLDNDGELLTNISISIRVACLLADKAVIPDALTTHINMHELMGLVHVSYKIKILIKAYGRNPDNREIKEQLEDIKKKMHHFSMLKYKDTNLIVAYKKMERYVHTLFEDYKVWMISSMRKKGFSQLSPMLKEDIITTFIVITKDTGEGNEISEEDRSVRNLLNDFPDEEKQPGIFIMPNEFLHPDIRCRQRYFEVYEPEAEDIKSGYLQKCFEMPDLNFFGGLELMRLRKELHEPGILFRKKMDEWLMLCSETEDVMQRINFFKTEVMPAAEAMEKPITENHLFQYNSVSKNKNGLVTSVFIGEVPVRHVRNFFRHFKDQAESSWNELRDTEENDPRLDKRIPLMFTTNNFLKENIDKDQGIREEITPDTLSTKKSLSID